MESPVYLVWHGQTIFYEMMPLWKQLLVIACIALIIWGIVKLFKAFVRLW